MQLHQTSGRWRLGLALSLVTVFLWGILPIALTVTLQQLDVYTVTWFRFIVSFTLLAAYLIARHQKTVKQAKNSEKITKFEPKFPENAPEPTPLKAQKDSFSLLNQDSLTILDTPEKMIANLDQRQTNLPFFGPISISRTDLGLLAIATIFLASNYLLFLQGLAQTSPANAQVLIQLAPVLMGLGGLVVFKERYTLIQWGGLSLLSLGFSLFFHEQLRSLITAPSRYLIGCGIIVLAAATWAVYALAQKQLLQRFSSTTIMLILYGGCALLFSPFATPQPIITLSPLHLGMLLFCALNTLVAYGAFAEALEHWEASRISAVLALTPIVTLTAVWAVSVFLPTLIAPERLTGLAFLGAILVVSGSMTIALGKKAIQSI